MHRRHLLLAALGGWTPVFAHHGWSGFDTDQPIYLEGRAASVQWRNPHAELVLELKPDLTLPTDLAKRTPPAQTSRVDGPAVLAKARLPQRRDKRWTIELAPLTRMEAWQVKEIKPGANVAMVGYTTAGEKGDPVLRVEYLFVDNQVYGLRSSPA